MEKRKFANGMITEIGLGCWQIGGNWGEVKDEDAMAILDAAYRSGVRFFDTAAVYGGGRSEKLIGRFLATLRDKGETESDPVFIATKIGRGASPGAVTATHLRESTKQSRENLGVEALDLTQLHCFADPDLKNPEVWDTLREMRDAGLIRHFGASVESIAEARFCMAQEGCASLQIIFNIFRQHPRDEIFAEAKEKGIALIVRLPLSSGLLAGKFTSESRFAETDHRHFNRDGDAFHVGETFSGLPFERGVALAERVRAILPEPEAEAGMAHQAIRWVLDHDAVTVVIPGASRAEQAAANSAAAEMPSLPEEVHIELASFYRDEVASLVRGRH